MATEKMTRGEFANLYQQTFGKLMPGMLNMDATEYCNRYPPDRIREAFRIGAENGAGSWSYVKTVLEGKNQKVDPMAFLDDLCKGDAA